MFRFEDGYQEGNNYRGKFRTQTNILLYGVNYFRKKLHLRCLTEFWMRF